MYTTKKKIKTVSLREIATVAVNSKRLKNEDLTLSGDHNLELVHYFVEV